MSKTNRVLILATALVALLAPAVVSAFTGTYVPTTHSHTLVQPTSSYTCAGSSRTGYSQVTKDVIGVRTNMKWNTTNAQNVKNYASKGQYYTHDITDKHEDADYLNGWCIWTNFPQPYYDWDDDDGDQIWEESEVLSRDPNFPSTSVTYSVNSYFSRWALICYTYPYRCVWEKTTKGNQLVITPQISQWSSFWQEYNTVYHAGNPVVVNYPGTTSATSSTTTSASDEQEASSTFVASIPLDIDDKYRIQIAKTDGRVYVEELDIPVEEVGGVAEYVAWSRTLTQDLQQAGTQTAEVVVTLNRHITPHEFMKLIDDYQLETSVVHVEYVGVNQHGEQEVLTGFIRNLPGTDFSTLDQAAAAQGMSLDLNQPHGVVAIHGTMPVAQIDRLNRDNRVFLADPLQSYVALAALRDENVQTALDEALVHKQQKLREQLTSEAQQGDKQASAMLASPDVDQVVLDIIHRHPELRPHVEVETHDLWHLIQR